MQAALGHQGYQPGYHGYHGYHGYQVIPTRATNQAIMATQGWHACKCHHGYPGMAPVCKCHHGYPGMARV